MNNLKFHLLLLIGFTSLISCSDVNDSPNSTINAKSEFGCEMTIEPETSIKLCINGTDFALPNEVITFTTTFYSREDNPSNSQFSWDIESGSMEILNIENIVEGEIAKSMATIKFNSDYSGNGIIITNAENSLGFGSIQHNVELESN